MMRKMVEVRTGVVRASGYARKIRKVFYGALAKTLKDKSSLLQEIGKVNKQLYDFFREKNIKKEDVVSMVFDVFVDTRTDEVKVKSVLIEKYVREDGFGYDFGEE